MRRNDACVPIGRRLIMLLRKDSWRSFVQLLAVTISECAAGSVAGGGAWLLEALLEGAIVLRLPLKNRACRNARRPGPGRRLQRALMCR